MAGNVKKAGREGWMFRMGKILIFTGSILCLAGIVALVLAVFFFGKQRNRLIRQINNEYKEG